VDVHNAMRYHTMEICVSAFVGATQEDIDFALRYLRNLGKCSPADIDRYSELVAPLRLGPSPILCILEDIIEIQDDDEESFRVHKRFKAVTFKPEGLTVAKSFR